MARKVVNVVVAGLGGQGVLKASDILAHAAFCEGYDVKKAEVHGMSQRGGSVCCDVRYGDKVDSPMVPPGEAHFLLVLAPDQVDANRQRLGPDGVLIDPSVLEGLSSASSKSNNVALLGALSVWLDLPESRWLDAVRANLPEKHHAANLEAFAAGRQAMLRQRKG